MRKTLADGRIAEIIPLTFGRARIIVAQPEWAGFCYDDGW